MTTRTPTLSDLRTQWRDGSLASCDVDWLLDEVERLTRELAEERHLATVRGEMLTRVEAERDAALRDNAALRACLPTDDERYQIGVQNIGPRRGVVLAWFERMDRLSPPSAPARDADWLLDPNVPKEAIDAELRSMGVDPEEVRARGAAFVAELMAKTTPAQDAPEAGGERCAKCGGTGEYEKHDYFYPCNRCDGPARNKVRRD